MELQVSRMLKKHRWEELKLQKKITSKLFGGKCYVCHRPWGKGFTFHHKKYISGEKTYSDFATPREYYEYLLPIIRKYPNRFAVVCSKHHRAVELGKKYKLETWQRLYKLVNESR